MTEQQKMKIDSFLYEVSQVSKKYNLWLDGFDGGLYIANGNERFCNDGDIEVLDDNRYALTWATTKSREL